MLMAWMQHVTVYPDVQTKVIWEFTVIRIPGQSLTVSYEMKSYSLHQVVPVQGPFLLHAA